MKFLTALLAFFSGAWLFAQSYEPLLDQINEWQFTSCNFGCITDIYYTDGDTLVNNKTYKILDGYHYINRNLLLRENTSERKVYLTVLEPQYFEDLVLYDFSMEVGDSIEMLNPITPFPTNGGYFLLDSINLLPLANGNDYRHFYFSPTVSNTVSSWNAQWIEGVGSLSIINAPGGSPDINAVGHLSCSFKNAELFYSNLDSINACEPAILGIPEMTESLKEIQLFSQTEKNHFLLTNTQNVYSISVFGLTGKLIKTVAPKNQNNVNLDLSTLKPGIYILKVKQNNYKQKTFKVVIK
ncbi:MAG: T9SS type A sorting domain-containing protein [Flavobacteriaceae bacterium]